MVGSSVALGCDLCSIPLPNNATLPFATTTRGSFGLGWDSSVSGEEIGLKVSCILTPEKLLGSKKGVLGLPHLPSLLSSLLAPGTVPAQACASVLINGQQMAFPRQEKPSAPAHLLL